MAQTLTEQWASGNVYVCYGDRHAWTHVGDGPVPDVMPCHCRAVRFVRETCRECGTERWKQVGR